MKVENERFLELCACITWITSVRAYLNSPNHTHALFGVYAQSHFLPFYFPPLFNPLHFYCFSFSSDIITLFSFTHFSHLNSQFHFSSPHFSTHIICFLHRIWILYRTKKIFILILAISWLFSFLSFRVQLSRFMYGLWLQGRKKEDGFAIYLLSCSVYFALHFFLLPSRHIRLRMSGSRPDIYFVRMRNRVNLFVPAIVSAPESRFPEYESIYTDEGKKKIKINKYLKMYTWIHTVNINTYTKGVYAYAF